MDVDLATSAKFLPAIAFERVSAAAWARSFDISRLSAHHYTIAPSGRKEGRKKLLVCLATKEGRKEGRIGIRDFGGVSLLGVAARQLNNDPVLITKE